MATPEVSGSRHRSNEWKKVAFPLGIAGLAGIVVVLGIVLVGRTGGGQPLSPAGILGPLLWALALFASGTCVGFLFGHPKAGIASNRGNASNKAGAGAAQGLRTRPSTSLEEIVDWLTKIIVGLGLVELRNIPGYLDRLTATVGPAFGPESGSAFTLATATILFFSVDGFLFGYTITRLYLQGVIDDADNELQERVDGFSGILTDKGVFTDALSTDAALWNTDPNKGRFGGKNENKGRRLTATISPAIGRSDAACKVTLTVSSTNREEKLTGEVTFHLHPTYNQPVVSIPVNESGAATLELPQAWGAFTVGAVADGGSTTLELDLTTVGGGTEAFYSS